MTLPYKILAALVVLAWALGASWLAWNQSVQVRVASERLDALEASVKALEKVNAKQAKARVAAAESVRAQRAQNEKERADAPRVLLPAPELERLRKLTDKANSSIVPGASSPASSP